MKSLRVVLMAVGLLYGASDLALAKDVTFKVNDVPGYWFDTGVDIAGTRSLGIIAPGDMVKFKQDVESRHTVTSLIWPSNAKPDELIDQDAANVNNHHVKLKTPGLYVFVCKLHPYMLGGVIVDDKTTPGLDIGQQLTLLGVTPAGTLTFDSYSDLTLRLLRAFFVVTNPSNWKDYTLANGVTKYQPVYPNVPVRVYSGGNLVGTDASLPLLGDAIVGQGYDGKVIPTQVKPSTKGVGDVWVDTQFELTAGKAPRFPGTISVVDATNNWEVTRKIALPVQKMNNGHNMWPSHNQEQMYQTEWHGKSLYVLNRADGALLQEIEIGHDPAHVMTRVDTEQVHVGLNGEDGVVELDRNPATGLLTKHRVISMQDPNNPTKPTQPHAHWMGHDGATMATPNANTADSSLFDFDEDRVVSKLPTGALSIAVGMMPDSSKYYVSNYLGHDLSLINMLSFPPSRFLTNNISLLLGYDPASGSTGPDFPCTASAGSPCLIGGLPVQTPVSPDGKFVVTGNTLGGTITILDTATNQVVAILPCDPGCHGVQFGAKAGAGGGYYAYVTSKFANRLIVLDYDPNNDGILFSPVGEKPTIAGWVILANDNLDGNHRDDVITGNKGMGGQGVMPVPNVYNGWVQKLPTSFCTLLSPQQRNPIGNPVTTCP